MGSVQGGGIETGGWRAFPDEVSQDLEDLRGVGDHGDDFHGLVTTRAAQGVRLVDLLDQAGPCGAALPGRHRQLWLRLIGRTDADSLLFRDATSKPRMRSAQLLSRETSVTVAMRKSAFSIFVCPCSMGFIMLLCAPSAP